MILTALPVYRVETARVKVPSPMLLHTHFAAHLSGEKRASDRLLNSESREMCVEVQFVDENGEIHTLSRRRNGSNTTIVFDTMNLRQTDVVEAVC